MNLSICTMIVSVLCLNSCFLWSCWKELWTKVVLVQLNTCLAVRWSMSHTELPDWCLRVGENAKKLLDEFSLLHSKPIKIGIGIKHSLKDRMDYSIADCDTQWINGTEHSLANLSFWTSSRRLAATGLDSSTAVDTMSSVLRDVGGDFRRSTRSKRR